MPIDRSNTVAHEIAKKGLINGVNQFWVEDVHDGVWELMNRDLPT